MLSFLESPFCVQVFVPFLFLVFFLFCLGCVLFFKIKLFVLELSHDFFVFCSFVFRLESSLQKNNLSSFKLVLIRFGYCGFSFLSHVVELWFFGV